MAEITCEECKTTVSDETGYCTECGFPFESAPSEGKSGVQDEESTDLKEISAASAGGDDVPLEITEPSSVNREAVFPVSAVGAQLDMVLRSLDTVGKEMRELRGIVDGIRQEQESKSSEDGTGRTLAEISARLDSLTATQTSIQASLQPVDNKKKKRELLSAFYQTLNSPNSMFEYMFYICVVQIIFVVVNLFLAAYIVTLIRE